MNDERHLWGEKFNVHWVEQQEDNVYENIGELATDIGAVRSRGDTYPGVDLNLDGETSCAELARSPEFFGAPHTRYWVPGNQVSPFASLKPGTLIAAFQPDGQYLAGDDPNRGPWGHTAVYVGFAKGGINIGDQFGTGGL